MSGQSEPGTHLKLPTELRGIISGGVSAEDFSAVAGTGPDRSEEILNQMVKDGIGIVRDGIYYFEEGDRLKAAMRMVEGGAAIDEVSATLDWRDFESLTAQILSSKRFAVIKNMILTKPRMEIDVVGIRLGVAILIDCKHWKRHTPSSMRRVVQKQIRRTRHYVAKTHGAVAVPAVVTLHQNDVDFVDRVPIVPIFRFSSFVDEFYGNLDQMDLIRTG